MFDVIVGNPPYKKGLHYKILYKIYDATNKYIIWLNPASWLIDEKNLDKKIKDIKQLIGCKIDGEIKIFNGNDKFNIALFYPMAITPINKQFNKRQVTVYDEINNKRITYNNINEVNKFANNKEYFALKEKILGLTNVDNLHNHINQGTGNYYINFPYIKGNIKCGINKLYSQTFPILISRKIPVDEIIKTKIKYKQISNGSRSECKYVAFNNYEEAYNFIKFLKTRWAMFALSIYKINQHLRRKEMSSIPWLDWSQEWTEEKFEEYIGATEDEINFVMNNIPNYYNIKRK